MFGDEPTIAAGRTLSGEDTIGAPVELPVDAHPTMAGRYQVREILGRGGMGVVYLAHDPQLGRDLALKVCLDADEATLARVRREAKALAALTHPNVIDVYDIGEHEGLLYIAMEYVSGGNAKDRFSRGHLRPYKEVLEFYRGAAMGLAAAHRADIIHRDFKPENVLITRDGLAKVADFGLATASGSVETPVGLSTSDERITRAGAVVGTPAFMAPEQLLGLDVDARADQYAFCATVFEGLYGRRPYPSGSVHDRLSSLATASVSWPRDTRGVPKRVVAALERGLSMDPAARFESMDALLQALGPVRRAVWPVAAAAAGLVALASAMTWAEATPAGCTLGAPIAWSGGDVAAVEDSLQRLDPTALARVTRDLDRFAESWNAERDQYCAGDGTTMERAAQRTCLTRTHRAFDARVELLRSGDADVVSRAQALTANLPLPDTCRAPGLDTGETLSPAQHEIITLLERAMAHGDAGRILEADGLTAEALSLARALDQPSLLTRALIERGEVVHQRGNEERSIELIEEAYFIARANGDGSTAADAARLLGPRHAAAHHDAHALRWLDIAQTELDRVGGGSLHLVRGRTLMHLERFDEAEQALALALEELDGRRPNTRYGIVATQAALATLQGVPARERAHFTEERLALALELFGPAHPDTAIAYEDLATVLRGQGRYDEAIEALEKARAIQVDALGPSNLALVELDNKLSTIHAAAGDLDAAESLLRRALLLQERSGTGNPAPLVNVESNLGNLLQRSGRIDEAIDIQERALTHAEEAFGAEGIKTAMVRANLASVLLEMDRTSRALELLEEAFELFEARLDPRHPATFITALTIVQAYIDAGRLDDAEEALDQARTYLTDAAERQAQLASSQAQLELERGHEAAALEGSLRCAELLADAPSQEVRLRCLERAARILVSRGQRSRARALLEPELETIRRPDVPQVLAASVLYALALSIAEHEPAAALAEESKERVGSQMGKRAVALREELADSFPIAELQ